MYSAYKLNKQGDNIQPWQTPFPIWNQSVFPCPILTVASWPAYKFLKRQVRWSGIPISFRIFHSLLCMVGYINISIDMHEAGNGNPLQYSCLQNPMDRGTWRATVHGITESDTTWWLNHHHHIDMHASVYLLWASQVALVVKNLLAKAGDVRDAGSVPGSGRSPGGGHGNPLQYSCLENPHGQRSLAGYISLWNSLGREAWWATVQRVAKSQTQLKQLTRTHAYIDYI